MQEEKRNQLSRDYTATVLGMIGRTLAGEAWSMRPYIEMAYPELDQTDTRTPEEIKDDIVYKLTGQRVNAGKEETSNGYTGTVRQTDG